MATAAFTEFEATAPKQSTRLGWALTGLAGAFLMADAAGKLLVPELMIANSPPLGLPTEPTFHRSLGAILALATALYLWPRTAFIGAILLTGYLGGAIATHLRVGSPVLSHTMFGLYVGLAVWGGLWLRDQRVRALLPFRG